MTERHVLNDKLVWEVKTHADEYELEHYPYAVLACIEYVPQQDVYQCCWSFFARRLSDPHTWGSFTMKTLKEAKRRCVFELQQCSMLEFHRMHDLNMRYSALLRRMTEGK